MEQLNFNIHKNFILIGNNWGDANKNDIITLLDSIIFNFYGDLDKNKISDKKVLIKNDSRRDYAEFIPGKDFNTIILATGNNFWCQYSYQFAHELCHHIINTDWFHKNDRFGRLEESICELASIYVLKRMGVIWKENPPYLNRKEYSSSLELYVKEIINKPENIIKEPFKLWFYKNISSLYTNRYKRTENRIIAIKLLPTFLENPELWKSIQYLNKITVTNKMGIKGFLNKWKSKIPKTLRLKFKKIKKLFIEI